MSGQDRRHHLYLNYYIFLKSDNMLLFSFTGKFLVATTLSFFFFSAVAH